MTELEDERLTAAIDCPECGETVKNSADPFQADEWYKCECGTEVRVISPKPEVSD